MGAYKTVDTPSSVHAAISDAYSVLEELGSECREIVDNASEGLSQTQRIQTLDETACTLEDQSEPSIPDCLEDKAFTLSQQVNRNKRRGESRAVRCSNACDALAQAIAAIEHQIDQLESKLDSAKEEDEEADDQTKADDIGALFEDTQEQLQEKIDVLSELRDKIQETIDNCESLEFPGMFG